MRTFLARCTMLGLLVGGFALTGDAGWILQKGQSLLNATTVPSATDLWSVPTAAETTDEPAAPWGSPAPSMADPVNQPAAAAPPAEHPHAGFPGPPLGPVDVQVAPSLAAPGEPPPAGGGEAVVDLRLLRPGQRVRLWTSGGVVAFDLVDPAAGEAIQQPWTRRVRISGRVDPHRIERGGMIVVQPRAGISGHQPPAETLGPVQAIGM
jgi:hypothetical protein